MLNVLLIPHEVQSRMRGVLHRAFDHLANTRYAERKKGRPTVRAIIARPKVRDLRQARTARLLRHPTAFAGHVRFQHGRGDGRPDRPRASDAALISVASYQSLLEIRLSLIE